MINYTVKPFDSISKIARDVLGDITLWPSIATANNLKSPYTIYPGQVITLPDKQVPKTAAVATTTQPTSSTVTTPAPGAAKANTERIVIVSLLGLAIGAGVWWFTKKNKKKPKPEMV
jgi:LysM repeat protein